MRPFNAPPKLWDLMISRMSAVSFSLILGVLSLDYQYAPTISTNHGTAHK